MEEYHARLSQVIVDYLEEHKDLFMQGLDQGASHGGMRPGALLSKLISTEKLAAEGIYVSAVHPSVYDDGDYSATRF